LKLLPLHYYSAVVGHATVDDNCEIDDKVYWKLEIPYAVRKRGYTPDVVVALLREDETLRARCHVFTTLSGLQPFNARLAKVVLTPSIIPQLNEIQFHPRTNPRKEAFTYEITHALRQVDRVIFLDKNRTNCQLENLRLIEIDLPPEEF
jgi:hypothetical protein